MIKVSFDLIRPVEVQDSDESELSRMIDNELGCHVSCDSQ